MSVGFIIGTNKTDRTNVMLDMCLQEAKNKSDKHIFILVPEKYTFEMEKRLAHRLETDIDPYFRIRVVSFSTLSRMVFTRTEGLNIRKISQGARLMILYKTILSLKSKLKFFTASTIDLGLVAKIMDAVIEFKQSNMEQKDIEKMAHEAQDKTLKLKLEDLSIIYEKYEKDIENKIDTEDYLEYFHRVLRKSKILSDSYIFIDEYTGFTPLQYKLIEELILQTNTMYISLLTDLKNFSTAKGAFSKTNITYSAISSFCIKNKVDRLKDINLYENKVFENKELEYLEKEINYFNPRVYKDQPVNHIHISSYENIHCELESVADKILELIKGGYRYGDITIAARDLDKYSYLVKAIFPNYNIGYFLDEKIASKNNPIVALILSIFDMKVDNYSYKSIFKYLKSGLLNIENEDISLLENYVLENGIKGKKWFEKKWNIPLNHGFEDQEIDKIYMDKINSIKDQAFGPVSLLHEKLKGRNKVGELCRYLYDFCLDIGLNRTISTLIENYKSKENLYKAKEYAQIWNVFIEILDEMVEFIGHESIGLDKFIKMLEAEFESAELGIIPPSRDQVFVTSIDRMKNPDTKVLFLLGVNEGVFPKNASDESLINDSERIDLCTKGYKFDTDAMSKIYQEQFLIYKSMSTAKNHIYISFPYSDYEGNNLQASKLIAKILRIFPTLKIQNSANYCKDLAFKLAYFKDKKDLSFDNKSELLDKVLADKLYGRGIFSISRLEKYVSCPFSYFMTYGMKAKPRPIYEFNDMDLGNYYHKVLEEFSKYISVNSINWDEIDKPFIDEQVENLAYRIVGSRKEYILNSSEKYKNLYQRLNHTLKKSIFNMGQQVRQSKIKPKYFELEFGPMADIEPIKYYLESKKEINLMGKIDRMDTYIDSKSKEERLSIIDYKSSSRNIDLSQVYAGLQLQLFVYMSAITKEYKEYNYYLNTNMGKRNTKLNPAALLYSRIEAKDLKVNSLRDYIELESQSLNKKLEKENKLSGYVIKDLNILEILDKNIKESGDSSFLPIKLTGKTKDSIGKNTAGLYEEEYKIVSEYVINKTKGICEDIYDGNTNIYPTNYDNRKACEFCYYKSVCKFDISNKENYYHKIIKHKNKEDGVVKSRYGIFSSSNVDILNLMEKYNEKNRRSGNGE
ncbi:PD-(D/E)XK nuclease family protein [Peptostreptococcus equinus]|uniref:Exodeoxyribonuclease V subunit gamma n=1 Tax=Peptostreptococcus equinus TaxID=3003601 RepID=A0ABY7JQ86_9FIRM|nr:PD-(D/E)XK nuclease family protein [Peptostreptococcus sp. CBA3647]WAW14333.1 exodeoxyribonuclease V subunit gamma [Peptostreptococcus sp. CBA3647]